MAEQDIDIFGEYTLNDEEKELIFGGTKAEDNNFEAEQSLYKERESVSGQDYSSNEDINLLGQIDPEEDVDQSNKALYKDVLSRMAKEESSDKKNQPMYLQKLSESSAGSGGIGSTLADISVGAISGIPVAALEVINTVDSAAEGITNWLGADVDLVPFDDIRDSALKALKKNKFTESMSGQISQGIGQFVTGFIPIFRALKSVSLLNNSAKKVIAADALTSATVFNPDDPNAFNMVQHVGVLKDFDDATGNAVTDMLATDPNDPELYNRFRNAASGVIEGAAVDGIFKLLKYASVQAKGITQEKLGLFKGTTPEKELTESISDAEAQIVSLEAEVKRAKDPKKKTALLQGLAHQRALAKRLEEEATGKPFVEEKAYDFEENQLSRDSQEQIEVETDELKEKLNVKFETALKQRYEKLPNDLRGATPSFYGQRVNFKDDITKSIYIVTDRRSLETGKLKDIASKSNRHSEYQAFLTDTVGMSEAEIFEIGKRIDRDLKAGDTVGSLKLYRLEIQDDIASGKIDSLDVTFNTKLDPESLKAVNVPMSENFKPLVKPISMTSKEFEELADSSIDAYKGIIRNIFNDKPLWKKGLPKGVKVKISKNKKGSKVEKSNITGQPKFIFKSKTTGKWFRIEHGDVNTPKDLDNLYTWLRRELSDRDAGPRIKLRAEEAKAQQILPQALDSNDPLKFMLNKGISAETAILSRLIHGAALHNLRDLALKRAAGDKSTKVKNAYLKALAYWSNAHAWQGVVARRSAQATRAFGHTISSGVNAELLEKILLEETQSNTIPFAGGLDKLSKMISKTESLEGANGAIEAVMDKSGITDVMIEHYMGVGLLSGVSTQIANLMGGMGVATVMQPIEKMVGKFWGGHSKSQAVHELIDGYVGLFGGTLKNLKLASKTVWEGKPQGFAAQKMEIRDQTITGQSVVEAGEARVSALRFLGNLNRGGTRFLIAGDDFVRSSIHTMQVTAAARSQARAEGLTGQAFKDRAAYLQKYPKALKSYDAVKLESTRLGDEATFTQKLDGLAAALGDTAYQYPLIRLFTPFVKVMYNLPKYFLERDPLSQSVRFVGSSSFRDKLAQDTKFRNNFFAKMSTGTMLLGAGTMLAINGKITGSARKDYGQEKNKMMINHFPNSYRYEDKDGKISNIDLSRLEPYASFFQYSADLVELLPNLSEKDASEVVSQAVWAMSDNIISDTWVPGLSELMNVMMGRNTEQSVETALKRMVSGFTPAIARELSRSPDTVIPESRGGALELFDDKMVKYGSTAKQQSFQQLLMRMYSTIPGYNGYPKYDRWGNMMMRGGSDPSEAHPLEFIAPWSVKRQKYDKVDEYLDEIKLEISDLKPAITIGVAKGGSVPLNPAQFDQYHLLATKELSGLPTDGAKFSPKDIIKLRKAPSRIKSIIKQVINSRGFKDIQVSGFGQDDNQRAIIKSIILKERERARSLLLAIKGNEGLLDESIKRAAIARENPNQILN
jgi:hypothetical protein